MVQGPGALDTVDGQLPRRERCAGVVDEHIDARVAGERLIRKRADRRLGAELGMEDVDLRTALALDALDGLHTASVISRDNRQLRTAPGQRLSSREADPARGAGDQHPLVAHASPFRHRR